MFESPFKINEGTLFSILIDNDETKIGNFIGIQKTAIDRIQKEHSELLDEIRIARNMLLSQIQDVEIELYHFLRAN
jgi:hypothetical protein